MLQALELAEKVIVVDGGGGGGGVSYVGVVLENFTQCYEVYPVWPCGAAERVQATEATRATEVCPVLCAFGFSWETCVF